MLHFVSKVVTFRLDVTFCGVTMLPSNVSKICVFSVPITEYPTIKISIAGDAIFPFVNGRCHLEQSLPFLKQSLPFITVVAILVHASSDKNVKSSRK